MHFTKHLRKIALGAVVAAAAISAAGTPALAASTAPHAASVHPADSDCGQFPEYAITGEPTGGFYLDDQPNTGYPDSADGLPMSYNNDPVCLSSYEYSQPVGPYNNILWYFAYDLSTNIGGWINDHYLTTTDTAANPVPVTTPLEPEYGSGTAPSQTQFATVGSTNWGNFPTFSYDSSATFASGDRVELNCYVRGAAAGPYNNTVWYFAQDASGKHGWINDHWLNTPGTAAQPVLEAIACAPAFAEE